MNQFHSNPLKYQPTQYFSYKNIANFNDAYRENEWKIFFCKIDSDIIFDILRLCM